jgi:hypothetical protein
MTTDKRVAELKIEQYRRQLASVRFWRQRRNLIRLLAAEEQKLEVFDGASKRKSNTSAEAERGDAGHRYRE